MGRTSDLILGKCLRKRRVEARRRSEHGQEADSCRQRIVCPSGSYAHSSMHTGTRKQAERIEALGFDSMHACYASTSPFSFLVNTSCNIFSFDTAATRSLSLSSTDPSPTIPTPLLCFAAINALYGSSTFDIGLCPLLGEGGLFR